MRRSNRLFEIIQILRATDRPMTAESLARQLEVSTRTIYRDIAALHVQKRLRRVRGGAEAIKARGDFGYTPAPGQTPVFG